MILVNYIKENGILTEILNQDKCTITIKQWLSIKKLEKCNNLMSNENLI
jgi:hypothetical protein